MRTVFSGILVHLFLIFEFYVIYLLKIHVRFYFVRGLTFGSGAIVFEVPLQAIIPRPSLGKSLNIQCFGRSTFKLHTVWKKKCWQYYSHHKYTLYEGGLGTILNTYW